MSAGPGNGEDIAWQRLDKWLWCARFLRHRADCARLVQEGHLRINRQPTDKAHARLRAGDVVTLPLRGTVLVVEVLTLAARRGPAAEARALYREVAQPEPGTGGGCGGAADAAYPQPCSEPPTPRSAR